MDRLEKRKSNEEFEDNVQVDIAKYSIIGKECASKDVLKHNYIFDLQKENTQKMSENLKETKSFDQFLTKVQKKSEYLFLKK